MGAQVANTLRSSGYDIKCLSNSPSNDKDVIYTDFSDRKHIRKTVMEHGVPDTFIHLGWGDVYQPHSEEHLSTNLQNGINLVDEFFDLGVDRFLLIGSVSEYGNRFGAMTEELAAEGPVSNYVKSKIALSQYGLNASERYKRKFIHIRLFNTYGAGQTHNSLINQLFQSYLDNKPISLSPLEQFRDCIHVSEAAEGIKRICSVDQSAVINLGSGRVIQMKEFVKILWRQLGASPELLLFGSHEKPLHEQNQSYVIANLTKLQSLTNWVPSLSIEDGIKMIVDQFFSHYPKVHRN